MPAFLRLFDAVRFAATASLVVWSLSSVAFGEVLHFTDYAAWSSVPDTTVSGTETFENLNGLYDPSVSGTVGGVGWTATATGGVYVDGLGGSQAMSTNIASPLVFSYDFGVGLTGVGGRILATNEGFAFMPGSMSVLVTLADTTSQAFARDIASADDFWGFRSTGAAISSITITPGAGYIETAFPTIDNMVVAVPEPSTWVMGAVGIACGAAAACRRRSKIA